MSNIIQNTVNNKQSGIPNFLSWWLETTSSKQIL